MRRFVLFAFTIISVFNVTAQSPKYRVVSIPVERNSIQLREPWVGGMDAPQFSACDLNHDGIKDLFVFDRQGDKVLTYLSSGNGTDTMYEYAPQYEDLFPKDLDAWALIRDYNNDGIPDIFTHVNGGTRVFKGSIRNGNLHFDLVCPIMLYNDGAHNTNIYTYISDIPVFTDVNRDGDMDVLTYSVFGGAVGYYENQTKEHSGDIQYDVDSFKMAEVTICWGGFTQNSASNSITLNVSCKGGGEQNDTVQVGERHAGNSIYNFDEGNDHDVDLLNGNIGYDNLFFLKNCGDSSNAHICEWDSIYPVCDVPIIMASYPAAFGVDVNNDSYEDLLIAPNVTNTTAGARNTKNVMYYKNTNNPGCQFEYQNDSFLVHDMLDFGTDSKPVFYDFNGDGLQDIVAGNYGYFQSGVTYKSTLAIYENIGTATEPKFRMRTEDYNGFGSTYGLLAMQPAFGDLDGDGKPDLLIGESNGYLDFFKNTSSPVSAYPSMTTAHYFNINVGQFSAPFIYDVNGDSLNDLVVGRRDGKLSYYWNFGTRNSPQFSADSVNDNFGNVNVNIPGYVDGYSQPFIKKDPSGKMKLYVGSMRGSIYEYEINPAGLRDSSFNLIDSDLLKHSAGTNATIAIADINNDGDMEYLVGNSRGGLMLYSDSLWDPGTVLDITEPPYIKGTFNIYPNPAKDYFICSLEDTPFINPKAEVFNILGARMNVAVKVTNKIILNTSELGSGFYVVRITDTGKTYTGKVLLQR